jgi:hypothetical protein
MRHSAKLTWKQEAGLRHLLSEPSVEAAARASGISSATYFRWLQQQPFADRYAELRHNALEVATARLQVLAAQACETLETIMASRKAPAASRASAARTVLEMALRVRELSEIEQRLSALEKIAAAGTGRLHVA